MPAYSPAPAYGFQQQIVHEADSGNQTHAGYATVPASSPQPHQRYGSTMSNSSGSPQVGTMQSWRSPPMPPQELGNDTGHLKGLGVHPGVHRISTLNQQPVELADTGDDPATHGQTTHK